MENLKTIKLSDVIEELSASNRLERANAIHSMTDEMLITHLGKSLKTSYNEEISILRNANGFSANIFFAGKVLKKNIPIRVYIPFSNVEGYSVTSKFGLGVITRPDWSEVLIGEVGLLKGGSRLPANSDDLVIEIDKLEALINDDIENPFLVEDVKIIIEENLVENAEFRVPEGISLPSDLKKRLESSLTRIFNITNYNLELKVHGYSTLRKMLERIKPIKYWDKLNLLLELTCVKKLKLGLSRKLIRDIKAARELKTSMNIPGHSSMPLISMVSFIPKVLL